MTAKEILWGLNVSAIIEVIDGAYASTKIKKREKVLKGQGHKVLIFEDSSLMHKPSYGRCTRMLEEYDYFLLSKDDSERLNTILATGNKKTAATQLSTVSASINSKLEHSEGSLITIDTTEAEYFYRVISDAVSMLSHELKKAGKP